jgi:branched-chain amino acid transport system ATP-binding protein
VRAMLELKNINVAYGDVQVIWDVSFAVGEGKLVALIGANGAGKTTTLKAISNILPLKSGEIFFCGERIDRYPPYHMAAKGIAHVPEGRGLFPELSVQANLEIGALAPHAKAKRAETMEMVFQRFPRLLERRNQAAGTLSGGEQQMLAVGRGLMAKPRLIMFDEPSLGLSPKLVQEIFQIIQAIRQEGVTILLVEQNVKQTLSIADWAYVLENGRIALAGAGQDLLDNDHVRQAYLGL